MSKPAAAALAYASQYAAVAGFWTLAAATLPRWVTADPSLRLSCKPAYTRLWPSLFGIRSAVAPPKVSRILQFFAFHR